MFKKLFLRKFIKVLLIIIFAIIAAIYALFYFFTAPKSDKEVLKKFANTTLNPVLSYQEFNGLRYRKLVIYNDSLLPTIVFVHGSIGSCVDFAKYMKDSLLYNHANFISYDRIGYNYEDHNEVQESIEFEKNMLQSITQELDKSNTVVVGYSYGGPIALADTTHYKKTILLAPAVFSKLEVKPWLLNFYNLKLTRWMVPPIWKQASKEKLSHAKDVSFFEQHWTKNNNDLLVIQGDEDAIVPFDNARQLASLFPKDRLNLVQIHGAGHGLIWTHFKLIREQLILSLR